MVKGGGLSAIAAGADAGYAPSGGYCALTIPEDAADAFTVKHGLANVLQWRSGAKRVYVMRAGLFGRKAFAYAGETCIVSAPLSRGGKECAAPMKGIKWIVAPSKVTLVNGALMECPDKLATLLLAGMGAEGPKRIDQIILG